MADFVSTIGLGSILEKHGMPDPGANFEAFFSELTLREPDHPCLKEMQRAIRLYFIEMQLPDEATLYDRLLLSLQPRDLIATFNWDPLLIQAVWRNRHMVRLPNVVALHGSVALGACPHAHSFGYRWIACSVCGEAYSDVPLLYPVTAKNYNDDGFIAGQWDYLRRAMKRNAVFTVFGFSAPATDVEAVELIHEMVLASDLKKINEFEIIDISDPTELKEKWKPFFVNHHYSVYSRFEETLISKYPRRTPEWLWMTQMLLTPFSSSSLPQGSDLGQLQRAAATLIDEEKTNPPMDG